MGKSVKETVGEYMSGTSVGGLAQMHSTTYFAFKAMWLVVFVVGLGLTIYNVVTITQTYLSYPIQVKVSLLRNETLEFPGVTLCNLNPVKKSKVVCTKYGSLSEIQNSYQYALQKYMKANWNTTKKLTKKTVKKLLGVLVKATCPTPNITTTVSVTVATANTNSTPTTTPSTTQLSSGRRKKRQLRVKRAISTSDFATTPGATTPGTASNAASTTGLGSTGPDTTAAATTASTGGVSTTSFGGVATTTSAGGTTMGPTSVATTATEVASTNGNTAAAGTTADEGATLGGSTTGLGGTTPGMGLTTTDASAAGTTSGVSTGGLTTEMGGTATGMGGSTTDFATSLADTTSFGGASGTTSDVFAAGSTTGMGGTTLDPFGASTTDNVFGVTGSTDSGPSTDYAPGWTTSDSGFGTGMTTSDGSFGTGMTTEGTYPSDGSFPYGTDGTTDGFGFGTGGGGTTDGYGDGGTTDDFGAGFGGGTTDSYGIGFGGGTTDEFGADLDDGGTTGGFEDGFGDGGTTDGFGASFDDGGTTDGFGAGFESGGTTDEFGAGFKDGGTTNDPSGGGGGQDDYWSDYFGDEYNGDQYGDNFYDGGPPMDGSAGNGSDSYWDGDPWPMDAYGGGGDYYMPGGGDYGMDGEWGVAGAVNDELSSWDFLDDIPEDSQSNFALLLKKGKLPDLTDVVELIKFSDKEFDDFGYTAKESLMECTNDRAACDTGDFKLTRSKRYGNCMTFNSKYQLNATVRRTRKSGSRYGLRVTVNIEAAEYVGLLASAYGLRVSIHPPDVSPEPEDDGFIAEPGKLTSVAVSQQHVRRLPLPYASACMSEMPSELGPYAVDESAYTIRQCSKACLDFFLHKRCNCVEQTYRQGPLKSIPLCDFFKDSDRTCRAKVLAKDTLPMDNANSTACDCRPQCNEISYDTDISTTEWPSESYRKLKIINFIDKHQVANMFFDDALLKADVESTTSNSAPGSPYPTMPECGPSKTEEKLAEEKEALLKTDISRNLVRIHIYYKSKTYEVIEEEPGYPLSNLFADIGGAVGLYLGMSMVTVIEVVQLFMIIFMICCGKEKKTPPPPSADNLYRKPSTLAVPTIVFA